jgi:translation initiation factor SUI1
MSDAFDEGGDGEQVLVKDTKGNYVHIRIQQRNGRKSLTTVQGLAIDLDLKKILKALKKVRGRGNETTSEYAHRSRMFGVLECMI